MKDELNMGGDVQASPERLDAPSPERTTIRALTYNIQQWIRLTWRTAPVRSSTCGRIDDTGVKRRRSSPPLGHRAHQPAMAVATSLDTPVTAGQS